MIEGYSMAAGAVDISPQRPIPLAGYSTLRKSVYERVADPLEANVVILRSGGVPAAFISVDLMYVGASLVDKVLQGIAGQIRSDRIFLTASHTHFGPPTETSLPVLGAVTPEYVEFVAQRIIALMLELLDKSFTDVALEYGEAAAQHSINRRSRAFGLRRTFPFVGSQMRIKPNTAGPRDDVIRLICVRGCDQSILAVCWSFACHPVGFPHLNDVSADFPGVVRNMLRSAFGNIPVVFWQGFSGNIRPLVPPGTYGDAGALQGRASFAPLSQAQWTEWSRSLGERVLEAVRTRGATIRGPISCTERSLSLNDLGLGSKKQVVLQEIGLGNNVAVCGINAEVAVEYVAVIQRLRAPVRVIPVGCVGDVFGYLPTSAMVPEGGYEVQGFLSRFGLNGRFARDVGAIVEGKLLRPIAGPAV